MSYPEPLDVLVVLGSLSDQAIAGQMQPVFSEFNIDARFEVCSAHRDHDRLAELVPAAQAAGAKVFIAVAGKAAHLPGVVAALTTRPVIGVPVESGMLGVDALLSIAQMPPGIPVAAMGVGAGRNAALLAVEILALGNGKLAARMVEYRQELSRKNREDSQALQDLLNK